MFKNVYQKKLLVRCNIFVECCWIISIKKRLIQSVDFLEKFKTKPYTTLTQNWIINITKICVELQLWKLKDW